MRTATSSSRSGGRPRGRQLFARSIFTADVKRMAAVSPAELLANNYPQKLANQMYYTLAAQSGKFFGYAGVGKGGSAGEGNQVGANWKSFTPAFYVVPPSQPRVKVWLVKNAGSEEVRSKAEDPTNLQGSWLSVPVPTAALIPNGNQIWPEGTDKEVVIWCPATDEYWEFWGFSKFLAGEHAGEFKAGFGGYIQRASRSNGVLPNKWGARASGLACAAGSISQADLVRVMRGGQIGHGLGVALTVTKGPAGSAFLAPATRNDSHENTAATAETNPAFGAVDAVPEGARFRIPSGAHPSDFVNTATEPIAAAIIQSMIDHPLVVTDTSVTTAAFYINDARSLDTPYSDTPWNAWAGWEGAEPKAAGINEHINAFVSAARTDPTLPKIKENLLNTKSIFAKVPWREMEQVVAGPN